MTRQKDKVVPISVDLRSNARDYAIRARVRASSSGEAMPNAQCRVQIQINDKIRNNKLKKNNHE